MIRRALATLLVPVFIVGCKGRPDRAGAADASATVTPAPQPTPPPIVPADSGQIATPPPAPPAPGPAATPRVPNDSGQIAVPASPRTKRPITTRQPSP